MYKIFLLTRDSATQSLWTPYKVTELVDNIEQTVEFSTDNIDVLESTVKELILTRPQKTIRVVQDMNYIIDVIVEGNI